jgi:hypothetical protein
MTDSNEPFPLMAPIAGTASDASPRGPQVAYGPQIACRYEALRLLGLGYTPLPINPGTKKPWLDEWIPFQTRQPTEDEIDQWYTDHPAAGVGIVTTGLLIIDIDGPTNPWPEDPDQKMDLSVAPCAETPGGGRHLDVRAPAGHTWGNWNGELAHKVDVKVDRGFLVVPPTPRPGGRPYAWQGGDWLNQAPEQLPLPPEWLVSRLDECSGNKTSLYNSKPLAGPIPTGQRNDTYYRHACLMRDTGADEALIFATLAMHNETSGTGMPRRELEGIARSAARREPTPQVDLSGILAVGSQVAAQEKSAELRAITLAELEDRPSPVWLIDGIIPDYGLGFIIGDPGTGKSLVLLDLAYAVACGRPFLGSGPVPNRTGWVLLLLAEGSGSWAARSKAYRSYYKIELTDQISAVIDAVDFSGPKQIQRLMEIIKAEIVLRNGISPALIILDTLSAAIPGVDENLQAAISPVTTTFQKWVRAGVAVIVAHHTTKNGNGYRGSSVLKCSADWMTFLKQDGRIRRLSNDKFRDGAAIADCSFEVIDHNGTGVARHVMTVNLRGMVDRPPEGLLAALRQHGWAEHGEELQNGDLQRNGVTLESILATWRRLEPITPKSAEEKTGYNKALDSRLTELIRWVLRATEDGTVATTAGAVSGKSPAARTASKRATIKQVRND